MTLKFEPGKYYHVYNRANGGGDLFFEDRNYLFFLRLHRDHGSRVADLFAYALLGNHFHLIIRVRDDIPKGNVISSLGNRISESFRCMFIAYTMAMNLEYHRTGSLFQRPFKRKEIGSERHLVRAIRYVHLNPQKHGFVTDFRKYPYTSFTDIISGESTTVNVPAVLDLFGRKQGFVEFHAETTSPVEMSPLTPDTP